MRREESARNHVGEGTEHVARWSGTNEPRERRNESLTPGREAPLADSSGIYTYSKTRFLVAREHNRADDFPSWNTRESGAGENAKIIKHRIIARGKKERKKRKSRFIEANLLPGCEWIFLIELFISERSSQASTTLAEEGPEDLFKARKSVDRTRVYFACQTSFTFLIESTTRLATGSAPAHPACNCLDTNHPARDIRRWWLICQEEDYYSLSQRGHLFPVPWRFFLASLPFPSSWHRRTSCDLKIDWNKSIAVESLICRIRWRISERWRSEDDRHRGRSLIKSSRTERE